MSADVGIHHWDNFWCDIKQISPKEAIEYSVVFTVPVLILTNALFSVNP